MIEYDKAAYTRGLVFGGRATRSEIGNLLDFYKEMLSIAVNGTPETTDSTATHFCSKYEVPISRKDPLGCFSSFVAGVNGANVPCSVARPISSTSTQP